MHQHAPPITHIITGLEVGGAERALYTLLTNGLEGPFRNRVISLMGPGHYGPLLEQAGIPVTCLHMRPGRPSLRALRRVLAACSQQPSAVIQGWMTHGNLAASLARRFAQPKAALAWNIRWTLEGLPQARPMTRALTHLGARLSSGPQAIIYNARRARDQHAALGYCDTHASHMPNGFDTTFWSPNPGMRKDVRTELGLSQTDRVIGFVGRDHADKDPECLFRAFARIEQPQPQAVLVAVGRNLAQFAPKSGRIIVTGQRADVPRLMQAFDLLCLSSRVEGFPNVIGEAMASGVPCVTTDVGDAGMIVGETGWIVPPRDSDALAQALCAALDLPAARLQERGQAARARIEAKFSISSVVAQYVALYTRLIQERP
jgi:glycosyltransferase involved in cell wall biosynthesis